MLTMYGEMFALRGAPRPAERPRTQDEMAATLRGIAEGDTEALLRAVAPTLEDAR